MRVERDDSAVLVVFSGLLMFSDVGVGSGVRLLCLV